MYLQKTFTILIAIISMNAFGQDVENKRKILPWAGTPTEQYEIGLAYFYGAKKRKQIFLEACTGWRKPLLKGMPKHS